MNWISLKKQQPYFTGYGRDFLVTDGKKVWHAWGLKDDWDFDGTLYFEKSKLTHWILFEDIDKPKVD